MIIQALCGGQSQVYAQLYDVACPRSVLWSVLSLCGSKDPDLSATPVLTPKAQRLLFCKGEMKPSLRPGASAQAAQDK